MWYYHEGSSNYSALKYSIQTTSNSSILNFNYDFAKAMDVKKPSYTEYLSGDNNIPGSVGLTDKTWYMFDFEIAYDEDVDNITLDQSDLFISARGINYSTLELSGSQTGKIAGNILLNSSSGTSLFNISNLVFNVGGKNNTIPNDTQTDVRTNDGNEWFNKIKESIENRFVTTVSDAVTKLASAGLNILTSPVGNFLNSLVHRGLSNNQASVDLSFATKVSIDGTLTSDQSVSSINLHMPGMMEDAGLVYIYDEPLGVFNLEKTPGVYYEQTYYLNDPDGARYYQYFNIDYSSINFKINPSILKDITNINKKTYLMYYRHYEGATDLMDFTDSALLLGEEPMQEDLVYKTKDNKFEFYTIRLGAIPPPASVSRGIAYSGSFIPETMFKYGTVIPADRRVVLKVVLQFEIKKTGKKVSIVKTYLPKFEYKQTIPVITQ